METVSSSKPNTFCMEELEKSRVLNSEHTGTGHRNRCRRLQEKHSREWKSVTRDSGVEGILLCLFLQDLYGRPAS